MHLGIHCSVRGGYLAAVEEARALGLRAMQMLPYRRHHDPGPADFAEFRRARRDAGIERLLVHSRYLPALATTDEPRRRHSAEHLKRELAMAQELEADAYVLHVGAYAPGSSFDEGARLFARSLAEARAAARLPVYIENVPGGGRRVGATPEELRALLAVSRDAWPETFLCLDTAHAWAAGVAFDALKSLSADVRAWHLNDSLAEPGSNLESHWHLGQGRIGAALPALIRELRETDAVVILETPKDGGDRRNLDWVKAC